MATTSLDRTPEQLASQRAHIGDDRRPDILAAQVTCFVAAYVGVGLRFWARRLARAQITTDDYWIITALVSSTLFRYPTNPKILWNTGEWKC